MENIRGKGKLICWWSVGEPKGGKFEPLGRKFMGEEKSRKEVDLGDPQGERKG